MLSLPATKPAALLAVVLLLGAAPRAEAQQPAPAGTATPNAAAGKPQAAPATGAARAQKAAPKSDQGAAAAGASGGDGALRQRVEALEEQLVDLQVTIGTLESLARSGGGAGAAAQPLRAASPATGADAGRVNELEMQVRALSAQLEQLSNEVRGGAAPRAASPGIGRAQPPSAGDAGTGVGRFGSTTVTAAGQGADADPIGGLIDRAPPSASQLPPPAGDGNSKQLYEQAYGYLLQQDYGAAEAAFDDFLKRYPGDQLAGNAQYWLGESHFVRGQFKAAAGAFLKGYQTYGRSPKAPDSLLKLAISLDRLGQRDAACSSFSELNTKYPSAPAHVKSRAESERRRLGCS